MERVVRFGVSLNSDLLRKFDEVIEEKGYMNRSEAIRDLIRDFLVGEEWERGKEVIGSLTLLYDHEVRGVDEKLTDIQHSHHAHIISSMHVHLDERNCIEVLVIKGVAEEVKKIADSLTSARGVKHGKLMMTSTGKEIT